MPLSSDSIENFKNHIPIYKNPENWRRKGTIWGTSQVLKIEVEDSPKNRTYKINACQGRHWWKTNQFVLRSHYIKAQISQEMVKTGRPIECLCTMELRIHSLSLTKLLHRDQGQGTRGKLNDHRKRNFKYGYCDQSVKLVTLHFNLKANDKLLPGAQSFYLFMCLEE